MPDRRALVGACLVAALAVSGCGGGGHANPSTTAAPPPAPGPIIGTKRGPVDPLSRADRAAAARATRRFLTGYLPFLYGRGAAGRVHDATPSVLRAVRRSHARVTPAQRQRRPRVAALSLTGQTTDSAIATVTIADGGPAPYRLSLTVERRAGRWLIADLGND